MLRYLWLPSYQNIQAQGFSFDPALTARYAADTGVLTLAESAQDSLPTGFFGRNIELLTGILGENGAGKSALVAAILATAGSFENGAARDTPPCLFVFGRTVVHQATVVLRNTRQLQNAGYRVYRYESSISYGQLAQPAYPHQRSHPDLITQHAYIHYANFMDGPWLHHMGVVDVSTAYLLNSLNARNLNLREDKVDSLLHYQTQNFEWEVKALDYLRSRQLNPLPFALPRRLQLEAVPIEQLPQAQLDDRFFKALDSPLLESWAGQLRDQLAEASGLPPLEEFLVRFTLPRLLVLLRVYPDAFEQLGHAQRRRLLRVQDVAPITRSQELNRQLAAIYRFARFVRTLGPQVQLLPEPERYGQRITRTITFSIADLALPELLQVFTSLMELPNAAQAFEATWSGLSSGQLAYLRLYARLYQALRRVENRVAINHHDIRSLTIVLDEAETAFHPQWQKNYLQLLLGIISDLFAAYRVQLIVCSNSPFIASDIPHGNLLLLHRQPDGACEVKPWSGHEKTFAANIHTLLTESFFMTDGLMGDFARAKVGQLIGYLQEQPAREEPREDMRQVLALIGEPVLRLKLQEMWADTFGTAERIAELERQLAALRQQQQGNG